MRQSPTQWQMARASAMLPGAERREAAAVLGQEDGIHGRHPDIRTAPVRGRSGAAEP
ncbi:MULTISPECIES: hypothetical protein [Thermobacillus]|uniref:Uncharacterized protein n=1 Tax=Thermobacillus composti (strain DSM 18247 / JCM 13945 / KWC4) TaxID=717605 RepID=L0EFM2_THECK|nr:MULTISPECIES: hypothetical protein [Thermobacillus]AGA58607.1 hypothetical protein Theco_2503 [Thermobacillus composti KWC4]